MASHSRIARGRNPSTSSAFCVVMVWHWCTETILRTAERYGFRFTYCPITENSDSTTSYLLRSTMSPTHLNISGE